MLIPEEPAADLMRAAADSTVAAVFRALSESVDRLALASVFSVVNESIILPFEVETSVWKAVADCVAISRLLESPPWKSDALSLASGNSLFASSANGSRISLRPGTASPMASLRR